MTDKTYAKATLVFALMVLGAFIPASGSASAYDPVEFLPPHSAVPVDSNMDSIYESVTVYAGVRVIDSGYYTVVAQFFQVVGTWMANSTNSTFMDPGDYLFETVFVGGDLYDDHLNGTYYVNLVLGIGSDPYNLTLVAATAFTAGNFTYDQFAEPAEPTHFETISDSGFDSDGDGLYNYLVVYVLAHITMDRGFHLLMGIIDGIGDDSNQTFATDGLVNMSLRFNGENIRNLAANGPYKVELTLEDSGMTVVCSAEYWTGNYTWSEFSNPLPAGPISFAPPHSGSPVDTDSDSLYELFLVNVTVNVTDPGWYFVVGVLYTPETRWTSGVWDSVFALHEVGVSITVLTFTSTYIQYYGLDGDFWVALELYTQDSTKVSTMSWYLGHYNLSSFDFPPLNHLEGCTDAGLDTNDDGLFEYLVLTVQVHVIDAGFYGVSSFIPDLMDNATGTVRVSVNLTEGIQTVDLMIRGDLFVNAGTDGPYLIYVELLDGYFNSFFDVVSYTTGNYSSSQFQKSAGARFELDHADTALDVNGDGAKEYLAVYVSVTVYVPGIYNVTGTLSVYVGFIGQSWNRTYLEAGHANVTLLFSGAIIKASKWNGSYPVNLNLSDADGNLLWSPMYLTNWYTWVDFASPPVAAFVAEPLVDHAGRNFTLNASVSYVEAVIFEVRWDFNSDGVWDTGWSTVTTILYEFPGPGNYTVTVEVRDVRGLTDLFSFLVSVPPEEIRPLPNLVADSFLLEIVFAIGIIGIIGTVAIFMAWPMESLIIAFLALLLPLYSRLRKDDVLDNYKRGMIHGLILAHPGISFSGMKEALAFSNGSLVYHLSILQEKGQVCCRKSGTLMRYYLDGSPVSHLVRLGLTDFQVEIVRHVLSRGETSKRDLQIAVKSSKQTLHYNLKKLLTDGILVSSFSGGHRTYRIKSGIESDLSRAIEADDRVAYAQEGPNALGTEDSSPETIES